MNVEANHTPLRAVASPSLGDLGTVAKRTGGDNPVRGAFSTLWKFCPGFPFASGAI
jgi:hypothetical protein